jgi:predicted RNase H-like HicB family nuclease
MKKDLKYYLNLTYPMMIIRDVEEGEAYYIAEIPDLPGCGTHGETIEEAIKSLEEAKELWIETSLEKGMEIPEPVSDDEFSGKFLLRIPPRLHMKLTTMAKNEELSLNQFIRKILESNLTLGSILEKIEAMEQEIKQLRNKIDAAKEKSNAIWGFYTHQESMALSDFKIYEPVYRESAESELLK